MALPYLKTSVENAIKLSSTRANKFLKRAQEEKLIDIEYTTQNIPVYSFNESTFEILRNIDKFNKISQFRRSKNYFRPNDSSKIVKPDIGEYLNEYSKFNFNFESFFGINPNTFFTSYHQEIQEIQSYMKTNDNLCNIYTNTEDTDFFECFKFLNSNNCIKSCYITYDRRTYNKKFPKVNFINIALDRLSFWRQISNTSHNLFIHETSQTSTYKNDVKNNEFNILHSAEIRVGSYPFAPIVERLYLIDKFMDMNDVKPIIVSSNLYEAAISILYEAFIDKSLPINEYSGYFRFNHRLAPYKVAIIYQTMDSYSLAYRIQCQLKLLSITSHIIADIEHIMKCNHRYSKRGYPFILNIVPETTIIGIINFYDVSTGIGLPIHISEAAEMVNDYYHAYCGLMQTKILKESVIDR